MLLPCAQPAQAAGEGQVFIPESSTFKPESPFEARTTFKHMVPREGHEALNTRINASPAATGAPPAPGLAYATPASIACIYGLVPSVAGCNPNNTAIGNPAGGAKVIAIVDAYHYPYAATDLQNFSAKFGLAAPHLTVVYAAGRQPPTSPMGWEMEEALDLQWAHAMAPNAQLYLIEAASNSLNDLLAAINVANTYVKAAGGGVVSMSWSAGEFSTEASLDASYFRNPNTIYFASSGDSAGTGWPCVSSNVVCVGGTTLRRDLSGNLLQEVAWNEGGGGLSQYYVSPAYQNEIASTVGSHRGVPDVSAAADPTTGAWVYYTRSDTRAAGWYVVGGTSWSSPTVAGIVNAALNGNYPANSFAELTKIYANLSSRGAITNFRDITDGWCSYSYSLYAGPSWDLCTGLGANAGLAGK
jgi:subtilase family serine protease